LLDEGLVLGFVDESDAGAATAFDLVLEAGALTASELAVLAGAEGEVAADEVYGLSDMRCGRIGSEVACSILARSPHELDAGELLFEIEPD
jgi:hypothetical protein